MPGQEHALARALASLTIGILALSPCLSAQDGNLYVVGGGLNGIWRFDSVTGLPYPSPGETGAVFSPNNSCGLANFTDVFFGPSKSIYAIGHLNAVVEYDGATGACIGEFVQNNAAGIANLTALTWGPDGNLYVVGGGINGIWRFRGSDGSPLPVPGQTGAVFASNNSCGQFNFVDLAFGPNGNIFTIGGLNAVVEYDGATGSCIGEFVPNDSAGISGLAGIAFGQDGHLYLVGGGFNGIWRFDGTTGNPLPAPGRSGAEFTANNSCGVANLTDIEFGPDGNPYVIGHLNAVVRYEAGTGNCLGEFVANNSAGIANLTSLAFPPGFVRDTCSPANVVRFTHLGTDTDGDCLVDLNPSGASIGKNWISTVDRLGADPLSLLFIGSGQLPCVPIFGAAHGGLLCAPPLGTSQLSFGVHCVAIPNNPSLIGTTACVQAASVHLGPVLLTFSNALDLALVP